MKLTSLLLLVGAFALPASVTVNAAEAAFRFNGSSTTHKILKGNADAVAAKHGAKIEFVPNGTGHGLEDLVSGRANVAMVTGDLGYFVGLLNEKKAGTADQSKLRAAQLPDIASTIATAIVHPSNSTPSLSREQLAGLFSGKITNWKEVGGPDLPVVVVAPDPYDGIWAAFTTGILKGQPVSSSARRVTLATDLARVVSQVPGAVAFCSVANATPTVKKLEPSPAFVVPNFLVTIGEPAEPLKSVITDLVASIK